MGTRDVVNEGAQAAPVGGSWSTATYLGNGDMPCIGLNAGGVVAELHTSDARSALYYRVGTFGDGGVSWGGAVFIEDGHSPSLSINNDGRLVQVHTSHRESAIWYRAGVINSDDRTIDWGTPFKLGGGYQGAVAINSGRVVQFHTADAAPPHLEYRVGYLHQDGKSVGWTDPARFDDGGHQPAVALNERNEVVEVHSAGANTMCFHYGTLDGDTISWGPGGTVYEAGGQPAVTFMGDECVLLAETNGADYFVRFGYIDRVGRSVIWERAARIGSGRQCDISANRAGEIIEIHSAPSEAEIWTSIRTARESAQ